MADSFVESLAKTQTVFTAKVLPIIEKFYSFQYECRTIEIEGRAINGKNDTITQDFDIFAGIDVYQVREKALRSDLVSAFDSNMIGIASRVQYGKAWNTFTVRLNRETGATTEYAKRKYAILNNTLYPKLTIQAYVQDDNTTIGICQTVDLIRYIDMFTPRIQYTRRDQKGQSSFYVCEWADMQNKGITVIKIEESQGKCIASWRTKDGKEAQKSFTIEKCA